MIHIIRHINGNTLGVLEPVLHELNLLFQYVEATEWTSLDQCSGLILLGGEMSVNDTGHFPHLANEQAILYQALAQELPIFGICLGAQILAKTLGAEVEKNAFTEIGWMQLHLTESGLQDPVMASLGQHALQFQWHEDTFQLPEKANHLARTDTCPRQAYRINSKTYGVQFHPEVTLGTIRQWVNHSASLSAKMKRDILDQSEECWSECSNRSRNMFLAYCKQAYC